MDTFEKLRLIRGKNGCKKAPKRKKEPLELEIAEFYKKKKLLH